MQTLSIFGADVVLRDRLAEECTLFVENGRIARLIEGDACIRADETIDASGLVLYPGFIDIHNHGAVGVDVMSADTEGLSHIGRFLAKNGVTGWLPTLIPTTDEGYASAVRAVEKYTSDNLNGEEDTDLEAHILGLHYEGPFINAVQCGALRAERFRAVSSDLDIRFLQKLTAQKSAHLITLSPEIEGGLELIRTLRQNGWVVALGHTRATIETLECAHAAGAKHITHFYNAMTPLHHRSPGPVGWGLTRHDVTCDVIADGCHCDPLMLRLLIQCKTAAKVSLISDSIAPAGLGDGTYQVWGETVVVAKGRTSNSDGALAGSVITVGDAARMMLSLGYSPVEVAHMSATNPAQLLQLDNDIGVIEVGRRADLVALNGQGAVQWTCIGGTLLR